MVDGMDIRSIFEPVDDVVWNTVVVMHPQGPLWKKATHLQRIFYDAIGVHFIGTPEGIGDIHYNLIAVNL